MVLNDVRKAVPSNRVQRGICANTLAAFQLKAVKVVVKDLIFKKLHLRLPLYEVVPDLYDIVIVVDMSANEGVEAGLKSSYKLLEMEITLIRDGPRLQVENLKHKVGL
jgi:hypothetical protein